MNSYFELKNFFSKANLRMILAADAQPRSIKYKNGLAVSQMPAGGVAIALDPIAKASNAVYIARGKDEEEKKTESYNKILIQDPDGGYTLKRLFINEQDLNAYYYGFSNQTLWPLCHVTFEPPQFERTWYEGYKKVNEKFAQSIRKEIKGKTFIWIHDYQLALVPKYLGRPKNTIIAFFWHIPWPTWEVFRILPFKNDILDSLLQCDFVAFHRGYQARNFIETVRREFQVRVDEETSKVFYHEGTTTVKNLPLGIDTDRIKTIVEEEKKDPLITKDNFIYSLFANNRIILGVDRLDYTKGLVLRLFAIDKFLENNPSYQGNIVYLGLIAPSREPVPSYQKLKKDIRSQAERINEKYGKNGWKPIQIVYNVFQRREIINFYQKSDICLVTPRDDGMNLVSKEFVLASSFTEDPGMLILSRFAGSAIDLIESIIVNPYDIDEVSRAIKRGLEMSKKEKIERIKSMVQTLEEKNIYEWTDEFIKNALIASRDNKKKRKLKI